MKNHIKGILFALALLTAVFAVGQKAFAGEGDPAVVKSIELTRYVGKWKEIAHSPNWFQGGCVRSEAEYKLLTPGKISVKNTCYRSNGAVSGIKGVATVVNPKEPAKLKVKFNNVPFPGDYWVVALDPNYQWSVVSGPGKSSLFILARQAPMDPQLLKSLLRKLKMRGFEVENLIFDKY